MVDFRHIGFLVATLCALPAVGVERMLKVDVVLLAMDEAVWQQDFQAGKMTAGEIHAKAIALSATGKISMPVAATLRTPESQQAKWQQGKDITFHAGWEKDREHPGKVVEFEEKTQFVGTTLTAECGNDPFHLELSLRHTTLAEQSTKHVYDTQAEGIQRLERAVATPVFDTLQWQGTTLIKAGEWTRAASILQTAQEPGATPRRWIILIRGGDA
ncbi:MAG: hypothetical protein H7A55_09410 [Verrucomicrobiaceae bacterium]|nr:hypothetical protein [Verrucomicrobiaceae bacterium]